MNASYNINQLSEDLFRHESGKMIALLTKIFGTENLDLSEDVVQETFITAMQLWPLKGVPDNPSAWLFRTAKNKAIDQLRRNKFSKQIDFSDPDRVLLSSAYTLQVQMDKLWNNDRIEDDMLRMMFACCHPDLSVARSAAPGSPAEHRVAVARKSRLRSGVERKMASELRLQCGDGQRRRRLGTSRYRSHGEELGLVRLESARRRQRHSGMAEHPVREI